MKHTLRMALTMALICRCPELLAGEADVGQVAPRSPRATVVVDCGATHSRVPLTGFLHGCYGASEEGMLRQDHPDRLIVLPCRPGSVPVSFALHSPHAGRVEGRCRPAQDVEVAMELPCPVGSPVGVPAKV